MAPIDVQQLELAGGAFELRYDCVRDQYTRPGLRAAVQPVPSFESLAEKSGGVYRKVEPEWRAFLTSDGPGELVWRVKHAGADVKSVEVRMGGMATFRQGELGASIVCGAKRTQIPLANGPFLAEQQGEKRWGANRESLVETMRLEDVGQSDATEVHCFFNDLTANAGLDHDLDDAQIFRTPLDAPNDQNLVIRIEFGAADPVVLVSDSERGAGIFELKYDCARDQYTRPYDAETEGPIAQFQSLAGKRGGVYRKVEPDWRAFVSSEGPGKLRYVIAHPGAKVKSAEVRMSGVTTFRRGEIGAELKSGDKADSFPLANAPFLAEQQAEKVWGPNREPAVEKLRLDDVGESDKTEVVVQFNDVTLNEGLDHDLDDAQVFRNPLDEPNPGNLVVHIEFEPSSAAGNLAIDSTFGAAQHKEEKVAADLASQLEKSDEEGKLRELVVLLSRMGVTQRYRVVQLVRSKYGIDLATALKSRLPQLEELIQTLVVRQLAHISIQQEEQQVARRVQQMQMSAPEEYIPTSQLHVKPIELDAFRCFLLKYDCVRDAYTRPFDLGGATTGAGWQSLVHSANGVQRMADREKEEYAYLGSRADDGELVWRIEHPGAQVHRVQVLISGMATLDAEARIGVDLRCGAEETSRRPDAIPYNAQRIDVMEMENVGQAHFTEVRVHFIRDPSVQSSTDDKKPSQLFRAVFGDAATAEDFAIRIEFSPSKGQTAAEFAANRDDLAQELKSKLAAAKGGDAPQIVQIITIVMNTLNTTQRIELFGYIQSEYGIDLSEELKSLMPRETGNELVELLFSGKDNATEQELPQQAAELRTEPPRGHLYPKVEQARGQEQRFTTEGENMPSKVFDLDQAAEAIHRSIVRGNGGGGLIKMFKKAPKSDTDQILSILTAANQNIRQMIAEAYKSRYEHEDLADVISKELPDDAAKELILALLRSPDTNDAVSLHKAMKGLGTDEHVLTEILTTRSNAQIQAIKKKYVELYGKQLETDITGDTSGTFLRVLTNLCAANRDEGDAFNPEKAVMDSQTLFGAGERKLGTDEHNFVALFTRESQAQLRLVFSEYQNMTGHTMEQAVAAEFSGDALDVLMALVKVARSRAHFFAERINVAIKNHNERDLIRLVVGCAETFQLSQVVAQFQELFGGTMVGAIETESKADTKGWLSALVKAYGGA